MRARLALRRGDESTLIPATRSFDADERHFDLAGRARVHCVQDEPERASSRLHRPLRSGARTGVRDIEHCTALGQQLGEQLQALGIKTRGQKADSRHPTAGAPELRREARRGQIARQRHDRNGRSGRARCLCGNRAGRHDYAGVQRGEFCREAWK